ncbi:hypothetical protein LCGC14_1690600, partial [marine sediment metagenome]
IAMPKCPYCEAEVEDMDEHKKEAHPDE